MQRGLTPLQRQVAAPRRHAPLPTRRAGSAPCRAALQSSQPQVKDLEGAYDSLSNVDGVYLVSSQSEVAPAALWARDERCVLVLGRSMG